MAKVDNYNTDSLMLFPYTVQSTTAGSPYQRAHIPVFFLSLAPYCQTWFLNIKAAQRLDAGNLRRKTMLDFRTGENAARGADQRRHG